MMNALSQLSSRFVYVFTLAVLVGLVGCAPAGSTSPGNTSPGNLPTGNDVGNGPVSKNGTEGAQAPDGSYSPYPMPQPNMPAGIVGYAPSDGARVCPTPRIALALRLTDAMREGGAFKASTVTLTLDGRDILSQIQVIAPMTYPQSQVTLTYAPSAPLGMGAHQLKLTYPSPSGSITLPLNFTVADIPCQ